MSKKENETSATTKGQTAKLSWQNYKRNHRSGGNCRQREIVQNLQRSRFFPRNGPALLTVFVRLC
jgi:hypothetical protein